MPPAPELDLYRSLTLAVVLQCAVSSIAAAAETTGVTGTEGGSGSGDRAGVGGLVALPGPMTVEQIMDRVLRNAEQRGLALFAPIDHAAGAARAGRDLRPKALLVLGNPKGGSRSSSVHKP